MAAQVCQLVIAVAGGRCITLHGTDIRKWSDTLSPMVWLNSDEQLPCMISGIQYKQAMKV